MEEEELPYTEEDLDNLRKIFSLFDKDGEGVIELSDMQELMKSLGKTQNEA
jgi:Ca2+-binding EF-hand superfamily protein